jgi:hypothetical protein
MYRHALLLMCEQLMWQPLVRGYKTLVLHSIRIIELLINYYFLRGSFHHHSLYHPAHIIKPNPSKGEIPMIILDIHNIISCINLWTTIKVHRSISTITQNLTNEQVATIIYHIPFFLSFFLFFSQFPPYNLFYLQRKILSGHLRLIGSG